MAVERILTRGWPKGDMALRWGVAGALLAGAVPGLATGLLALLLASLTLHHHPAPTCHLYIIVLLPCSC